MYVFKIADIAVEIEPKNDEVKRILAPFSSECESVAAIEVTDLDIVYEKGFAESVSDFASEATAILRKMCDLLLYRFDGMFLHSATVVYNGGAYAFSAPSGTGKTTHILKWKRLLGDKVRILNGDKLFLRYIDDEIVAYGNPWQGKENLGENDKCLLKGIFVIKRDENNFVRRLSATDALMSLVDSTVFPKDSEGRIKVLEFFDKLISAVPVFELHCNLDDEAVYTAISATEGNI